MKRFEWRVYSVRNGVARSRILQAERRALRRLAWLTGDWAALGLDPREPWCCFNPQCGCYGETRADRWEREQEQYGRVTDARIERREVGRWEVSLNHGRSA